MSTDETFATWGDVAAKLRASKAGTMSRMARAIGMQPSSVSRSIKNEGGDLTVALARRIAGFFAGLPDEDLGGLQEAAGQWTGQALPAFGYVAPIANDNGQDRFRFAPGQELDYYPLPAGLNLNPAEYFVVIQPSSTMEPRIFAGEALVVRRNLPPARDRQAVIEFTDGTAVVKNYRGARSGRIFAEQFNPPETVDYDATTVRAIHGVYLTL